MNQERGELGGELYPLTCCPPRPTSPFFRSTAELRQVTGARDAESYWREGQHYFDAAFSPVAFKSREARRSLDPSSE